MLGWGQRRKNKDKGQSKACQSSERKAGRKHGLEPKEVVGAQAPQQDEKQTYTRGWGVRKAARNLCESGFSGELEADDRWQHVEGRMGSEKRRWRASSTGRGERERAVVRRGSKIKGNLFSEQDTEILKYW